MRRLKRDRNRPIPKSDLDEVARFRAEMKVYAKLLSEGKTSKEARTIVWVESKRK